MVGSSWVSLVRTWVWVGSTGFKYSEWSSPQVALFILSLSPQVDSRTVVREWESGMYRKCQVHRIYSPGTFEGL